MTKKDPKVIAVLTAGGSGTRMNQDIPKQFLTINERPVIVYTLEAFQKHPGVDAIIVACKEGWINVLEAYAKQFNITKLKFIVLGGETGQESIYNCLTKLEKHYDGDDIVLIHDGNRPMVSQDVISDCINVTVEKGCAIAAIPCTEVVLKTTDGVESNTSYNRDELRRTQTPHGFHLKDILRLHRTALEKGMTTTAAACSMAVELGEKVYFSAGSEKNLKLTTVEDIEIFKALLAATRPDWIK